MPEGARKALNTTCHHNIKMAGYDCMYEYFLIYIYYIRVLSVWTQSVLSRSIIEFVVRHFFDSTIA